MVTGLHRLLPANGDVMIHPSVIKQQTPRQDQLLKAPQESASKILQETPLAPSLS